MRSHHKTSFPFRLSKFSNIHASGLPSLATNRLLGYAAAALIGVFFPIFLYEFFNQSIAPVILWYVLLYGLRVPLFIVAGKVFGRIGLLKSMAIGTLGYTLFFAATYLLDVGVAVNPYLLLGLTIAGWAINSAFYWSPYHIDMAEMTDKDKRGSELSVLYSAQKVVGVLAPALGGYLVAQYSYQASFMIGVVLTLLSLFPLKFVPKIDVEYEFGFFETFKEMFSKDFRPMTFAMMSYGAENVVGILFWPLFLFTVFKGDYLDIGLFATGIVVVGIVLNVIVGKALDKKSKAKILNWGTELYALGWFFKAFVSTVTQVFAASTFHKLGGTIMGTARHTVMYEQAADAGHYVDEYSIIREMALNSGRVIMLLILLVVTAYFSIQTAFIFAALSTLGITLLSKEKIRLLFS